MNNKILITGNAGSGKTTLSDEVAKLLNIREVIHLDPFVWEKNWKPVKKEIKEQKFAEIIKKNVWVVDGVSKTILHEADTVIFLDYPRYLCCFRVLNLDSAVKFVARRANVLKIKKILMGFKRRRTHLYGEFKIRKIFFRFNAVDLRSRT